MSKKFEIVGNFNNVNIEQATNTFKIEYLKCEDIHTNDFNFYSVDDVSQLKDSIEMQGLLQPLIVKRDGDDKYVLISGHRRFKAIQLLRAEGNKKYDTVPCRVVNMDERESELALINANATTRELTDYEKMRQVVLTKEILTEMIDSGKISGRIRDLVAKQLNFSATSVQRYDYISKNATPDTLERLKNQKIPVTVAEELVKQGSRVQATVNKSFDKDHVISLSDIEDIIEKSQDNDFYKAAENSEDTDKILDSIIDENTKRKSYVVDKENLKVIEAFLEKAKKLESAYILYDKKAKAYRSSEAAVIREIKKMSKIIDEILEN